MSSNPRNQLSDRIPLDLQETAIDHWPLGLAVAVLRSDSGAGRSRNSRLAGKASVSSGRPENGRPTVASVCPKGRKIRVWVGAGHADQAA